MTDTKKPGRPTEYDPARNAMVKQLYALGAVDDEVIKALGVARSTFYLWKQEHEAFAGAVQEGKDFFDSGRMEESLKSKAAGFYVLDEVITEEDAEGNVLKKTTKQKRMPPDTAALKYWLNNRQRSRWADAPEPEGEQNGEPIEIKITVNPPAPDELPEEYKTLDESTDY